MIYLISFFAITALLFGLYALVLVRPRSKPPKDASVLTDYAHRGLHGKDAPENSIRAFELAIKKGVGIELDVHLSKDETVMVFHDYSLLRMTGVDRRLKELTYAELKKLNLAKTEQKIPTFKEVLELVKGRVPILIELKGQSLNSSLSQKVSEHLKGYAGAYCVESFNPLLIRKIKKYIPDAYCGQLYTNVRKDKNRITPVNLILSLMIFNFLSRPDFIAYNKRDRNALPVRLATGFHKAPKFVWTVRGEDEINSAKKFGENAIFEIN